MLGDALGRAVGCSVLGKVEGLWLLLGAALGRAVGNELGLELGIMGQLVLAPYTCTSARERYVFGRGIKMRTPRMSVFDTPDVSHSKLERPVMSGSVISLAMSDEPSVDRVVIRRTLAPLSRSEQQSNLFQITTCSIRKAPPNSTYHHGSLLSSVCVMLLKLYTGLVSPSTALVATPP